MLVKSKTVLLLSDDTSFSFDYKQLAKSISVDMAVTNDWKERYRVIQDVVILTPKYLESLNKSYYNKAVLILSSGESPAKYIKAGIEHFIFDCNNQYELIVALFSVPPIVIYTKTKAVSETITDYGVPVFCHGDYDFRFDKDVYLYKDKAIYLTQGQKSFLAEWLIAGHKDNKKRMVLCNLRKKFGEEFLNEVDRFGRYGGKDEQ